MVFFRCIFVKRYSLYWKMYEHPGGSLAGIREIQGGTKIQKFSIATIDLYGWSQGWLPLCCFSLPQEIAACAGGLSRRKRDGKNPMAKWISRLLSLHAVVRSAHDACCTLTSEYVTNSECWSPCSNVADSEGWMGLVRKNEGFSSKDFYPQKKREDWKMQMKWTAFFCIE